MTREILITDLPRECIEDCSAQGSCDAAVDHWRHVLATFVDTWDTVAMRRCLHGYGAWDDNELSDDEMNRQRILWLACGTFSEFITECEDEGIDPFGELPENFSPNCGSDIFGLE